MQKAFSLLEIIISLVMIGIASLAIPVIIKLNADTNTQSVIGESIMHAKSALALTFKMPYTCAYINKNLNQSVPIFTNDENFYAKFNLEIKASRNFVSSEILKESTCKEILSIDTATKNYEIKLNEPNGEFMQNFIYKIKVSQTKRPFDENINELKIYDSKLITLEGVTTIGPTSQNINMHAIATNIGELESVQIKRLE